MHKFDISLLILNYNRSEFLDRSIRSCIEQITLNKSIEIIVVDDGSTDGSLGILKNFKKIKIIRNKKNMGIGYCSNLAVKKCLGKYFMRVDSDDYLSKFSCQIMSDYLDFNKNFAYVYADHFRVNEKGFKEELVRLNNKKKLYLHGAGVMFRTNIVKKVGNYNSKFKEAEDHDLIKRIDKKKYWSKYLPIPLYRYYIHQNNITLRGQRKDFIKKIT